MLSEATVDRRQTQGRWRDHPGGVRCNEGLGVTAQTLANAFPSDVEVDNFTFERERTG